MSLGILCSGQGAQHSAMFDLFAESEPAQAALAEASECLGESVQSIARCASRSHQNRWAQPLICAAEMAAWVALRPQLPAPRVFAGYSVGELAAYGCESALASKEVIALAQLRASLMDDATTTATGLVSVRGLGRSDILALCSACSAQVAIVNGPDQYVLGLADQNKKILLSAVVAMGAKAQVLPVSVASHTSWLTSASEAFCETLERSPLRAPRIPVLEGTTGLPVYSREGAIQALSQQICTTIDWSACLQSLKEHRCRVILELGPGSALARMAQAVMPTLSVRSIEDFRSLDALSEWVRKELSV